MHASYFEILDASDAGSGYNLPLSAEASEWLFSIGLWDSVNAHTGCIFGQYEDDILAAEQVPGVLKLLEEIEAKFLGEVARAHTFVYAWASDGGSLNITVSNNDLVTEVAKLKSLLRYSLDLGARVFCQL